MFTLFAVLLLKIFNDSMLHIVKTAIYVQIHVISHDWPQGLLIIYFTHVQYTQKETIRQTDGPLVPMVGLVLIEKDVIPMVLLVNMHLIKGT